MENDIENDKIIETLCLTSFVFVCLNGKGFYHCNEDHLGIYVYDFRCIIVTSLVYIYIYIYICVCDWI